MDDIIRVSGTTIPRAELEAIKKAAYNRLRAEIKPVPRAGFLAALEQFRSAGLRTAIGSLTSTDFALGIIAESGLDRYFPRGAIVFKESVAFLKPAPDVFLATARRMDIAPEDQIVFEDSPNGIRAALAAGSTAIGMPVYPFLQVHTALRTAGATRVYDTWEGVNVTELIASLE